MYTTVLRLRILYDDEMSGYGPSLTNSVRFSVTALNVKRLKVGKYLTMAVQTAATWRARRAAIGRATSTPFPPRR